MLKRCENYEKYDAQNQKRLIYITFIILANEWCETIHIYSKLCDDILRWGSCCCVLSEKQKQVIIKYILYFITITKAERKQKTTWTWWWWDDDVYLISVRPEYGDMKQMSSTRCTGVLHCSGTIYKIIDCEMWKRTAVTHFSHGEKSVLIWIQHPTSAKLVFRHLSHPSMLEGDTTPLNSSSVSPATDRHVNIR
jgi:hypothetical protein